MGAAVQLEGRLVGGDAVGAGDSWRGGRSGTHWKDRGEGDRKGRGRAGEEAGSSALWVPWGMEHQEHGRHMVRGEQERRGWGDGGSVQAAGA